MLVGCPVQVPAAAVAQLPILGLAPRVDLPVGGQRQAVLPARVHGHLPDEHVLNGLEQRRGGDGLRATDAQPAASAISCGVELRGKGTHRNQSAP